MQASDFAMSEAHEKEAHLGALSFEPYCCEFGHKYVLVQKGQNYAEYTKCLNCGAFTSKRTESKTVREASYTQSGEKTETFVCQHCGDTFTRTIIIPMLVHVSSGGSGHSSSSSHRSYSSHRSSGGSFGGGRSGGGGYSGRW